MKNGGRTSDDSLQRHMPVSEKKKARNIKNKRLLMHSDDVKELRVTWEEAQELLRPSPTSKPSVVMVEDHEFEEFEVCKARLSVFFIPLFLKSLLMLYY